MKAFIIQEADDDLLDTIIRAEDAKDAQGLLPDHDNFKVHEIRADVATSMGVDETRGRYDGALIRWIVGPTNLKRDAIRLARILRF